MSEAVVALDPGGTTGWAAWEPDEGFSHGQIGPDEHHELLYQLLGRFYVGHDKVMIACESFDFRKFDGNRAGINLISREYIGVTKLFAKQFKGVSVHLQSPGEGKGFVNDEKLKALNLWVPGQKHARDAYRHLIYFLVNKKHMYNLIKPWKEL